MPFLLLDDAADEATRRLQEYGQGLLQPLSSTWQQAGQSVQPGPQVVSPQQATQRLQDYGTSLLQPLTQQAPQVLQQQPQNGLQDITQRLQDFGSQQLQNAQQQVQKVQQLQPLQNLVQNQQPQPQPFDQTQTTSVQPGGDLQAYARQAAQRAGIDPDIFVRQIQQESGFNPTAKSPAGATGIAQFMPGTAAGVNLDPTDPYASLDAAAKMDAQNLSKYGGDWSKALAAYNAGGGNVDKYGGVPPFQETQNYVNTILGGAKNVVNQATQGAQNVVQQAQQAASNVLPAISQFGSKELSAAEAYAACGPAAAVRFATMMGRQPTLQEALDLARQVGWTPDSGMAGLGSESQLFDKMDIPHRMVGADWTALAREASSGNPVTISTAGHYFTADNYDPSSGAFHVGSSGTDLKGGSEWMTPAQMEARMGKLQGGMAVDNPQVPAPSPLASGTQAVQNLAGQAVNAVTQAKDRGMQILDQGVQTAAQGAQDLGNDVNSAFDQYRQAQQSSDLGNTLAGTDLGKAYLQSQADVDAAYARAGLPPRSSGTGIDPYGQIVQQGIPQIVRGVQQGNLLGVLGGAAQTGLGALSVLPGTGGAGNALRDVATGGLRALDAAAPAEAARVGPSVSDLLTSEAGELNPQALATPAQAVAAPLKNAPAEVQSILRTFAGDMEAARGQADYLAKKAAQVLGPDDNAAAAARFEQTGQFVANPTPAQQALADEIQQFNQQTGNAGRAAGYIRGDVTAGGEGAPANYFPHAYETGPTIAESVGPESRGGLNPKGSYSQSRVFPTLDEAMQAGYQPVDSVGQPLGSYARAVQQSQAKFDLVDRLKTAVPDGIDVLNPGDRLQQGFVSGAAIDPQLTGLQIRQDIATPLQNILQRSESTNGVLNAIGTAKEVMLSLSPFHLVTELRQAYRANNPQDALPMIGRALWNMWSPNWDRFVVNNHDLFQQAQQAGVTQLSQGISPDIGGRLTGVQGMLARGAFSGGFGGLGAYTETKREGGSDQDALMNGLKAGAVTGVLGATAARPLADALFQRVIPTLKVLTYGLKQAGGADPQAAATFVNQTFGGQNLNMIARSQGVQNMLRTALLAPDWWEGWARQVGGAAMPGDIGTMSRGYWARTLAEAALTLGALNYALSGHTADQNAPGHQFDLETTNLTHQVDPQTGEPLRTYVNVLGPIKDIFTLATAPWQPGGTLDTLGTLASNKLGLGPSTALALTQNQDYQGNPIVPTGTPEWQRPLRIAENVLGNLAPTSTEQTMRESAQLGPGAAALTDVTGFRTSGQTPTQEQAAIRRAVLPNAEVQARQWLEQQPAFQQMSPWEQEAQVQQRSADLRASMSEYQRLGPTGELLANAGITLPAYAHDTMNFGGRQLTLTPAEQQQHQQVFEQRIQQSLARFVSSSAFQQLPPDRQNRALQPVVTAATRYADARVLQSMPTSDRLARLSAAPPSVTASGVAPFLATQGGIAALMGNYGFQSPGTLSSSSLSADEQRQAYLRGAA